MLTIGTFLYLFAPRWMVLLVWPVVLCYPQKFFYGFLPWNAGLDDLFIIMMAARTLLHSRRGRLWPWAKGAVFLAIGMLIMEAAADFTGAMLHQELLVDAAKNTLKGVVFVLFALVMAMDLRDEGDVRRHLLSFSLAMSAALTLVVVCFYSTSVASLWETQFEELLYTEGTLAKRAFGPFNGPTDVGTCVCVAVPIALALLVHKPRRSSSVFVGLLLLATSFAALIVAKTRAGIIGLAVMFVLMTLLSHRRKVIIAVEVAIVLITALYLIGGEVFGAARERLTSGLLSDDLATRIDIWMRTITQPSPWILFFGEGVKAFQIRIDTTPHNGYLDALFVWGFGGFVMFTLVVWRGLRWSSFVQRFAQDSRVRATAWGLTWSFVAIGGLALVSDPWYSSFYRFIIYFLLVVVCGKYRELRSRSPVSNARNLPVGVPDVLRTRAASGIFLNPRAHLPGGS